MRRTIYLRSIRGTGGMILLALLAVCGYIGADRQESETVSVAVTRSLIAQPGTVQDSSLDAAARLAAERDREIEMLRRVLDNDAAGNETKEDALIQMNQIAQRMEMEAKTTACLLDMGFDHCTAVSGAQMMHIITPYENVADDRDKNRMIDAVCGITGYSPADIKIILTKK